MKLKNIYFHPHALFCKQPSPFFICRCNFFHHCHRRCQKHPQQQLRWKSWYAMEPAASREDKVSVLAAVWTKNSQKVILVATILPVEVDCCIHDIAMIHLWALQDHLAVAKVVNWHHHGQIPNKSSRSAINNQPLDASNISRVDEIIQKYSKGWKYQKKPPFIIEHCCDGKKGRCCTAVFDVCLKSEFSSYGTAITPKYSLSSVDSNDVSGKKIQLVLKSIEVILSLTRTSHLTRTSCVGQKSLL